VARVCGRGGEVEAHLTRSVIRYMDLSEDNFFRPWAFVQVHTFGSEEFGLVFQAYCSISPLSNKV
jgi:hypothetical protein